jgi:hypothetical protein
MVWEISPWRPFEFEKMRKETQMMTADRKLFGLTARTHLKKSVMWLGNWQL